MHLPDNVVILLVEDRADDVLLIRSSLKRAKVPNAVYAVGDGEEAMAYLDGVGQYADRALFPLPHLILLDLKMPKMDGFELLWWIRRQPNLKTMRVVVLTSSQDVFDINRAYELGANSFLVKPQEINDFQAMMRTLGSFWLNYCQAPVLSDQQTSSSAHRAST